MGKKNTQFIKTNKGHIYRVTSNPNIFIKVSPYKQNEDRRVSINVLSNMITNNNATFLNKNKAFEEINSLWRNVESKWFYCGKQYKTKNEHFRFSQARKYTFNHTYINTRGEECHYTSTYYVCVYHGKLYWVQNSHYYPQLELYKFRSIDVEPSYNDFAQWTNVKNIKNLYEKNYEGKWVCV